MQLYAPGSLLSSHHLYRITTHECICPIYSPGNLIRLLLLTTGVAGQPPSSSSPSPSSLEVLPLFPVTPTPIPSRTLAPSLSTLPTNASVSPAMRSIAALQRLSVLVSVRPANEGKGDCFTRLWVVKVGEGSVMVVRSSEGESSRELWAVMYVFVWIVSVRFSVRKETRLRPSEGRGLVMVVVVVVVVVMIIGLGLVGLVTRVQSLVRVKVSRGRLRRGLEGERGERGERGGAWV